MCTNLLTSLILAIVMQTIARMIYKVYLRRQLSKISDAISNKRVPTIIFSKVCAEECKCGTLCSFLLFFQRLLLDNKNFVSSIEKMQVSKLRQYLVLQNRYKKIKKKGEERFSDKHIA